MTESNIPVPAESLRQLAIAATDEVAKHREAGRKATAKRLEGQIAKAFKALDGKDGEFVSVDGDAVSSITAEGMLGAYDHGQATKTYLYQYGVWEQEE